MKNQEKEQVILRKWMNTVSIRFLSKLLDPVKKEAARWTPFEGVPVSVPLDAVGHAEGVRSK